MGCDVAVVGGGVIGHATAYELARSGLRVVLFEDPQGVGQATSAATGLLVAGRSHRPATEQAQAVATSLALYAQWVQELERQSGVSVGYRANRVLRAPESAREAASLRSAVDRASGEGEWLSPQAVAELEPLLEPVVRLGAARFKTEAVVSPEKLMVALRRASGTLGTLCVRERVVEIVRRGGKWRLRSATHTMDTDEVVLAAGVFSVSLAEGLGCHLPLYPVRGIGFRVSVAQAPRFAVSARGLQVVPHAEAEVHVGATVEKGAESAHIAPRALSELRARSMCALPWLAQSVVTKVYCGIRPACRLGRPIIGRVPGLPGLSVAVGHYRSGLALAPLTAHVLREILSGVPLSDVARFFSWPA